MKNKEAKKYYRECKYLYPHIEKKEKNYLERVMADVSADQDIIDDGIRDSKDTYLPAAIPSSMVTKTVAVDKKPYFHQNAFKHQGFCLR